MDASTPPLLLLLLVLSWSWSCVQAGEDTQEVKVTAGEDATLQCRCQPPDRPALEVTWERSDLKSEGYVFFFQPRRQRQEELPRFYGRVQLRDPEMKDGDVSVVLKNVSVDDSGTYECRTFCRFQVSCGMFKAELSSTIRLEVTDTGTQQDGGDTGTQQDGGDTGTQQGGGDTGTQQGGGDTGTQQDGGDTGTQQDGGDTGTQQGGGDKDGSNMKGGDTDGLVTGGRNTMGGDKDGHVGLLVGVSVGLLVVVVVVLIVRVMISRQQKEVTDTNSY